LPAQQHAADDDRIPSVGICRNAGHDLCFDQRLRVLSAYLHRWTRLAQEIQPTYAGYSIGRWVDEDRNGIYSVLEVETRGFTGRRVYDPTGLPLHFDNQSIFKERMYRERREPNILHDEITVIDHALTRPWTVVKKYLHNSNPHPNWIMGSCGESSMLLGLGKEVYAVSADGLLMPVKKDQAPPDLRYFKQGVKQPQH
jgi:hypothetical protein